MISLKMKMKNKSDIKSVIWELGSLNNQNKDLSSIRTGMGARGEPF